MSMASEIDAEIESAANFCDNARFPRLRAAEILIAADAEAAAAMPQSSASSHSESHFDVKLPKLKLPTFSGNPV